MGRFLELAKQGVSSVGSSCSRSTLSKLNSVVDYLWVGYWMKARGFRCARRVYSREEVARVAAEKIGDRDVLYLEFGVYRGQSMKTWSRLLQNPKSRLHGFDSFEGLPEAWDVFAYAEKGHFDVGGVIPHLDDTRVTFFKGWFSDTLPRYDFSPHDELLVCFDADLYSSTKLALDFLKPHIIPGTYLYFDEFQSREHELRAFDEFLTETKWNFVVVTASRGFTNVLFQRTS
jgi:hypothetical protein